MTKPKISIPDEKYNIDTLDGIVQIFSETLEGLHHRANSRKHRSLADIIAIIVSILAIIGVIWKVATWTTEKDIKIEQLEEQVKSINNNEIKNFPRQQQYQDENNTTPEIPQSPKEQRMTVADFGIINSKIITPKSRTSFNLPYFLEENICEYNSRFYNWNNTNQEPKPLFFYKLLNTKNNLSSWCLVVGSFKNTKTPKRAFIVSEALANDLGFSLKKGVESIEFCHMTEDEWCIMEGCLDLRNKFFDKKNERVSARIAQQKH